MKKKLMQSGVNFLKTLPIIVVNFSKDRFKSLTQAKANSVEYSLFGAWGKCPILLPGSNIK
jgi:hypothetical protein